MSRAPPTFRRHLLTLWRLRLALARNRGRGAQGALATAAYAGSLLPGLPLGALAFAVMRSAPVAGSPVASAFFLCLLSFVTSCVFVAWPVLSAGVDDHSELSRFAAFPLTPARLLLASTLASLLEPRALVINAPLWGAAAGYLSARSVGLATGALALGLAVGFALFNAAVSRVALHAALLLLRHHRNAELIGGSFVAIIAVCTFIPPVDTSWLRSLGGGLGALPDTVLERAAQGLSRVPPGYFGHAIFTLGLWPELAPAQRAEAATYVLTRLSGLVQLTLVVGAVALGLLLEFQRRGRPTRPTTARARRANPFSKGPTRFRALLAREALDLWLNPRARLLASASFLVAIVLRLLSARDLFVHFLGATADAWLLGGLCLYAATVLGATFAQNAFGYDGTGLFALCASPTPMREVLLAKNCVHGGAAALLALFTGSFYGAYFRAGAAWDFLCVAAAVATLVPVLLAAGNFLSVAFPRRFHASLERRDRLPLAASALGLGAASLGASPWFFVLGRQGSRSLDAGSLLALALAAGVAWATYRASFPFAVRLLERRREAVLMAVVRD